MRFLRAGDAAFNMCIRIAALPNVALEPLPILAEIVPDTRECRPLRCAEFKGKFCGKSRYFAGVFLQAVGDQAPVFIPDVRDQRPCRIALGALRCRQLVVAVG